MKLITVLNCLFSFPEDHASDNYAQTVIFIVLEYNEEKKIQYEHLELTIHLDHCFFVCFSATS